MKPRKLTLTTAGGMGQALTELRRSNAAGTHGKKSPDRRNAKRRAIQESRDAG